jgi:hypothetical protein
MAEVLIHIGTHKTGATAIQHALRENRRWLRRNGWAYLLPAPALRTLMMAQSVNPEVVQEARAWLDSVGRWHGRRHRLLISAEGFAGNPYGGYRNADVVAENLRQITDGHKVGIMVYLRRQDEFMESMYTQRIQEGGSLSFAEFLEACGDAPDWSALLRAYAERFGQERIVVRRYHRTFLPEPDSLLLDFSRALHLSALPMERVPGRRNAGYSREALEFARSVNASLDDAERAALRRLLQEASARQSFAPFEFFNHDERVALMNRCADGNAEVARRYFKDAVDTLFPPPEVAIRARQASAGLSPEGMDRMLADARMLAQANRNGGRPRGGIRRRVWGWAGRQISACPPFRELLCRLAEIAGWR